MNNTLVWTCVSAVVNSNAYLRRIYLYLLGTFIHAPVCISCLFPPYSWPRPPQLALHVDICIDPSPFFAALS